MPFRETLTAFISLSTLSGFSAIFFNLTIHPVTCSVNDPHRKGQRIQIGNMESRNSQTNFNINKVTICVLLNLIIII